MADGATRIVLVEGGRKLSLDTGMEARQFARAGAARLASEEGSILLPDGSRSSWKIEGTTEIDSRIFAYGPFFAEIPISGRRRTGRRRPWMRSGTSAAIPRSPASEGWSRASFSYPTTGLSWSCPSGLRSGPWNQRAAARPWTAPSAGCTLTEPGRTPGPSPWRP
jgi:hypothetical protein